MLDIVVRCACKTVHVEDSSLAHSFFSWIAYAEDEASAVAFGNRVVCREAAVGIRLCRQFCPLVVEDDVGFYVDASYRTSRGTVLCRSTQVHDIASVACRLVSRDGKRIERADRQRRRRRCVVYIQEFLNLAVVVDGHLNFVGTRHTACCEVCGYDRASALQHLCRKAYAASIFAIYLNIGCQSGREHGCTYVFNGHEELRSLACCQLCLCQAKIRDDGIGQRAVRDKEPCGSAAEASGICRDAYGAVAFLSAVGKSLERGRCAFLSCGNLDD